MLLLFKGTLSKNNKGLSSSDGMTVDFDDIKLTDTDTNFPSAQNSISVEESKEQLQSEPSSNQERTVILESDPANNLKKSLCKSNSSSKLNSSVNRKRSADLTLVKSSELKSPSKENATGSGPNNSNDHCNKKKKVISLSTGLFKKAVGSISNGNTSEALCHK